MHHERGYVLLTLLLMVALMIIAAAAILPAISFEIRRDREEELIHRGVQYSRAIRTYYKKFGRYPTRIEELESTNNQRFLRKRYKDPITGQDFKLLHFGEVKLTATGGIGGTPALNGASSLNASPLGSPPAGPSTANPGVTPDQNQTPDANSPQASSGQPAQSGSSDQLTNQTFGGGPVVGVVSNSKKDSIREFNRKKKYNEWQFIYDPATDRGGLLMTPNQPPLQGFGNQPGQPQGNSGETVNGPIPGMQNNPNMPGQVGPGTPPPAQPPADQPQQ